MEGLVLGHIQREWTFCFLIWPSGQGAEYNYLPEHFIGCFWHYKGSYWDKTLQDLSLAKAGGTLWLVLNFGHQGE